MKMMRNVWSNVASLFMVWYTVRLTATSVNCFVKRKLLKVHSLLFFIHFCFRVSILSLVKSLQRLWGFVMFLAIWLQKAAKHFNDQFAGYIGWFSSPFFSRRFSSFTKYMLLAIFLIMFCPRRLSRSLRSPAKQTFFDGRLLSCFPIPLV